MKKLLTIFLLLAVTVAFGQKKRDTTKASWTFDTCTLSKYQIRAVPFLKPYKFVFMNMPDELLSISAPDSAGNYLIKFAKSKVKFINDSTFTFKINK